MIKVRTTSEYIACNTLKKNIEFRKVGSKTSIKVNRPEKTN